jgi:Tfp pilus assembly PilM family ATPase
MSIAKMKRGNLSPIGIDLGRRGVRVVQLTRVGRESDHWSLFRAFSWEWPWDDDAQAEGGAEPGSASVGASGVGALLKVEERRLELADRLRRVLRQNEFSGRDAVVGLSSPELEIHALEVPLSGGGSEERLGEAARWELERLVNISEGQFESDFWLLPSSGGASSGSRQGESGAGRSPGQPTVMGVAADKGVVSGVWRLCQAAGLVCGRLDAALCGASRFGAWLRGLAVLEDAAGSTDGGEAPGQIWGILDLGYTHARLVVCVGEVPVLVRCFEAGGRRWIRRVADALGLSRAAAEVQLREHGIEARGGSGQGRGVRADDAGDITSAQLGGIIRNVLREELSALGGEIERSYRYALQCYPQHRVSELMLVGGGAEMRNLDAYLAEQLGIEVFAASRRWERTVLGSNDGEGTPTARAGLGKRYAAGTLAVAMGLAIPPGPRRAGEGPRPRRWPSRQAPEPATSA